MRQAKSFLEIKPENFEPRRGIAQKLRRTHGETDGAEMNTTEASSQAKSCM